MNIAKISDLTPTPLPEKYENGQVFRNKEDYNWYIIILVKVDGFVDEDEVFFTFVYKEVGKAPKAELTLHQFGTGNHKPANLVSEGWVYVGQYDYVELA